MLNRFIRYQILGVDIMKREVTLSELCRRVISELEQLRYSESYNKRYRVRCNEISRFAMETIGEDIFTEELGASYLKQIHRYSLGDPVKELSYTVQSAIRCVRLLGEIKQYGAFVRKIQRKEDFNWAGDDLPIVNAYLDAVQTVDNSEATKISRSHKIKIFYQFLDFRGIKGIKELNAQIISDYALSMQGGALSYTRHKLLTLGRYFSFLFKNGYCKEDWSKAVPRIIVPENANVPTLWSEEELDQLLKSIDRGSPSGKRDYAVILLAIQLGLRTSDIAYLKLEYLKWDQKEIEFTQHKTGKRIILPMLTDTGWAIIDYIRFARPKSDGPFVFLSCIAPYEGLTPGGVGCILQRQMRRCGIQKRAGVTSGMHSLRHALARRLMEQGTSLSNLSEIMGHVDCGSTAQYLKVDIAGMRGCALSLEEVSDNA